MLLASAAVWFALTSHGRWRAAGAAIAVLAAAGLIVVLVTNWHGLLVLVALRACCSRCSGCARATRSGATGQAAARRATAASVVPAGAADSAVLIINLKSGGGKAERFDLAGEARRRGESSRSSFSPVMTCSSSPRARSTRGAQVIGMAGGDGSQALVATVAARRDVAHVCIPAGTRNHFALDLGLDREDVVGALDAFTDGVERRIDLAEVNDRVFVNNASLGVYAKVVQSERLPRRQARDLDAHAARPARPRRRSRSTSSSPRRTDAACSDAPLVLVSNNPYQLTQLAGAGTRERIDTGTLGIVAARVRSSADVSKLVALELAGQARPLARLAFVVGAGVRGALHRSRGDRPRRRGAGA